MEEAKLKDLITEATYRVANAYKEIIGQELSPAQLYDTRIGLTKLLTEMFSAEQIR